MSIQRTKSLTTQPLKTWSFCTHRFLFKTVLLSHSGSHFFCHYKQNKIWPTMHLGIGWAEKDAPDLFLKSWKKEDAFVGTYEFRQLSAHLCDVIGLQIWPSKVAAPDFRHSCCVCQVILFGSYLIHPWFLTRKPDLRPAETQAKHAEQYAQIMTHYHTAPVDVLSVTDILPQTMNSSLRIKYLSKAQQIGLVSAVHYLGKQTHASSLAS